MEKMYTLARGGRAKVFGYKETSTEVIVYTGAAFASEYSFKKDDIAKMLEHFKDKGWFILGNQVDNVKPNGMGSYLKNSINSGAVKYASHLGAFLVKQGKLLYRDDFGRIEFKVK